MDTIEVVPLTQDRVEKLMADRATGRLKTASVGRRHTPRWPFPGVVELWVPDENGVPQHTLATSVNLSLRGIGIRCDEPLEPGLELAIAFHEPELSFHGHAVTRHCTKLESDYLVGLEFLFEPEGTEE